MKKTLILTLSIIIATSFLVVAKAFAEPIIPDEVVSTAITSGSAIEVKNPKNVKFYKSGGLILHHFHKSDGDGDVNIIDLRREKK